MRKTDERVMGINASNARARAMANPSQRRLEF
jgi:hypothetical protein